MTTENEETVVDDGIEVEHSPETLEYLTERAEEVAEEFGPEDNEEEISAESVESTEEAEPAEEDKPSTADQVDALTRIMAKESKQRTDREEFDTERQQFADDKSALEAEVKEYRSNKDKLSRDPISFLKTLGASEDDLQTIAKMIYYDGLGEDAPSEYGELKDKFETKQEIAQLRELLEKQDTDRNTATQAATDAKYREEYVETLFDTVESISEDFPLSKKYTENKGEQAVVNALYQYAQQNATANNGEGDALTPEQCLQKLENQLSEFIKLNDTAPNEPAEKTVKKRKTLRTKTTKLQKPATDYENMTPEEVVIEARKRFSSVMNQ